MVFLTWLKAAVLGIVEGSTEFIPVSSTGHLILAQHLLGLSGQKENAFIIFIQLGAILAVVWRYRRKFLAIVSNWRRDMQGRRLFANLVIGTLPAVAVGLPTEQWIEAHFFRPLPVALAFILGGIGILAVERWHRRTSVESVDDIPLRLALGVGIIQILAILFPGVSRSGATIMGGLALGLSRTAATEFSFFLAIPAMLGASCIKLIEARELIVASDIPTFAIGFVVSFVVAAIVIRGLLAFVSHRSFAPFAWYRIGVGLAVIAAISFGLAG